MARTRTPITPETIATVPRAALDEELLILHRAAARVEAIRRGLDAGLVEINRSAAAIQAEITIRETPKP